MMSTATATATTASLPLLPVPIGVTGSEATLTQTVFSAMPVSSRYRSMAKGVALLSFALLVYGACGWGVLSDALPLWGRVLVSMISGVAIAMLFIVGHDACHDSLTPSSKVNKIIGRIGFLPSLHPFTSWEYYHNGLHHGQTNIKGQDPVYCPFTKEEYDNLPKWRQLLEKVYRTPAGVMLYYGVEYWWRGNLFPINHHIPILNARRGFHLDRALVFAYAALQVAVCAGLAFNNGGMNWAQFAGNIGLWLIVPHMVWNWLMGFTTFQHHTHPRTKWFRTREESSFFERQIHNTVEVVFPRWIEIILHDIMAHTAHHVAPRIALYNLKTAQTSLQSNYQDEVVRVNFSWNGYKDVLKRCRLYDYDRHCWLDYDGTPTTQPATH
jgi:acyl-lipid omega-6 desaturase (Delta-12 desaturase)